MAVLIRSHGVCVGFVAVLRVFVKFPDLFVKLVGDVCELGRIASKL